nr:PREDICTED: RAB6A-GEF complex partner protein 2 [Bemisia tabaci]
MIEVSAKLIGGPIFMPGETVGCSVTFTNPPVSTDKKSHCNSEVLEVLAWASAQIHCLCSTNDKISVPRIKETSPGATSVINSDTSFMPCQGDKGQVVFSTTPRILFCDLSLSPGESKSYLYSEVLPSESPPSHNGQLTRYSYKITIGTQRVNQPIKSLRIPFRVLVIQGYLDISGCEDSIDLSPSNPFLEKKETEQELGPALQMVQNITARRTPNCYNVTNPRGQVARFCLYKQCYKLGEDIIGSFDFSNSVVPCVQFTVTLQCEETLSDEYKSFARQDKAISGFSNCHQVCLYMKYCTLNLPIPRHVTPMFSTQLVAVNWRLHFEFVICSKDRDDMLLKDGTWQGPKSLDIETMVWDLPIQVYPAAPTPDVHAQNKHTMVF